MTNRQSLGVIGLIFGGVTAAVIVVALLVVRDCLDLRLTLVESQPPVVSASSPIGRATDD
jgi:hypothetical protein